MKLVIIESPFAGKDGRNKRRNCAYAHAAMLDSLRRGEAPFASHLLYTQVLDDDIPEQRSLGIEAGLSWGKAADLTACYVDLGWSTGMHAGLNRALAEGRTVVERRLGPGWSS